MKQFFTFLFSFLFVILIIDSQAQKKSSIQSSGIGIFATEGDVEVGGSVSFLSEAPVVDGKTYDAYSTFTIAPYVGYFLVNGLELGISPRITVVSVPKTETSAAKTTTTMHVFLAPGYNFRAAGNFFIYAEGYLGYSAGEDASGLSFGFGTGTKIPVTGNALLNVGLEYLLLTMNPSGAKNRYGINAFGIFAGFSIWFD